MFPFVGSEDGQQQQQQQFGSEDQSSEGTEMALVPFDSIVSTSVSTSVSTTFSEHPDERYHCYYYYYYYYNS
jgi:hypothetical protein